MSADRQADMEAAVLRFLDALHQPGTPHLAAVMTDVFAEAATYQALVPATEVRAGRDAIAAELSRQFTHYSECDCEVLAIGSSDRFVFTERRDHVAMIDAGKTIFSSVAAVFEFEAGQVVSWREYWDTGDISRQLGLTAEQMAELQPVVDVT